MILTGGNTRDFMSRLDVRVPRMGGPGGEQEVNRALNRMSSSNSSLQSSGNPAEEEVERL